MPKPIREALMNLSPRAAPLAGAVLAAAVVTLVVLQPGDAPTAAAQPARPAQLPLPLRFVPHDAALFLHVDVAKVWSHETVKAFRAADKATFAKIEDFVAKASGVGPGDVQTLTVFVPDAKSPRDIEKAGFVLTFAKPFDKKKIEAGAAELFGPRAEVRVFAPDDKTALVLLNLPDTFAKAQPADSDGHITPAIKAAAGGKHTLVAGSTLGNLPDELRKDDVPGQLRAFQPIFFSEAVIATLDLGASLDLDVRVKAKRPGQAADAEKALAALVKLIDDEVTGELPNFEKDADKNPGIKDAVKVLKAVLTAAKGAKFSIDGTETRMTASLPLKDLPLVTAYTATVKKLQEMQAVQQSANNLKQIGLALHNYLDTHNNFPPAAVCDKKGKPLLSWRVLILPYIEQEALYKEFKLDEPWDSDHNKKLIAKMPKVYAIPGAGEAGQTHYRVFVGNGAGFDWLTGVKITDITDGTSNTFMCVTAATAVPWTKPDELDYDAESDPAKLIGLVVNGKAQAVMFDGSVRTLGKLPKKETLHALITRGGGEVIADDF
ncbi:MAG: DUF1559 domain-containing protein [Gemmataceae bacterium]|nr:DUF1559 domain-containing protein [Gemmataceae bacterium]